MDKEVTNRIWTLPNIITFIRLLLVPVFVVLLVAYENNIAAFIVFLVAATTDFLDGAIARSTGTVSKLGQQLDPLVDRILILTAVLVVFIMGRVPFWVLLLLVARDLCMLLLVAQLKATGMPKLRVAFVGKMATALNMAGFCLLILNWPFVPGLNIFDSAFFPGWGSSDALLGIWFVYLGLVCAWAAGFFYLFRAYYQYTHPASGKGSSKGNGPTGGAGGPRGGGQKGRTGSSRKADSTVNMHARVESANKRRAQTGAGSATQSQAMRRTSGKNQTASRGKTGKASAGGGSRGKSKSAGAGSVVRSFFSTPKRALASVIVCLFVVLTIGFYGYDSANNFGVIHAGVKVGDLDVGHMNEEDAAALISKELNAVANSAPVVFYADEEAMQAGITEETARLGNGVTNYDQTEVDQELTSWSATLGTFDAEVNAKELAQEAYAVGRGGDFFLGRLAASLFGVTVTPSVELSTDRLHSVENLLTESIGIPMKNANIVFADGSFVAEDGQDGIVVEEEEFEALLQSAFFSDERGFVVPMVDRAMYVTLEDAELVAKNTQAAITEPVTLRYRDANWSLITEQLGRTIVTSVEKDSSDSWQLIASVDAGLLEAMLPEVIGQLEDQIAPLNAEFVVVDGALQIIPSQNGTGVNYIQLASDLNALLFEESESDSSGSDNESGDNSESGSDAEEDSTADPGEGTDGSESTGSEASTATIGSPGRVVQLFIGVLEPDFKTSDAESYDFSNKISEFTIEYPWVPQGTITNIHVASDLLNSSIIEPHGIWSFNETAGECTADKGFVEAQVILGNEYADEIGGGVCNVASTVYNAAYEAGYPIVERINHSLRLTRYPVGRDAAIAYPYADLKFENDTDNYLLLTMSYTDWSVTCTLWGISPGYTIESVAGELIEGADFQTKEVLDEDMAPGERYIEQEGKKATKVEVMRTVYYADGTLKEQRTFYSSYDPTTEIIKIGPKVEEQKTT